MRLHYSLSVCALAVITLAGCSASSGGRSSYYRSSGGNGGASVGSHHSYDADPPRPGLARSGPPATQTSARETPVQGISFADPRVASSTGVSATPVQQVGHPWPGAG